MPDRDSPGPPGHDVIFSGTVEETDDPFIVVDDEALSDADEEEDHDQYVYAIWKLPVFLARPRLRLRHPSAVFTASAKLKPAEKSAGRGGYLQSGRPSGLNLLEAFGNDAALGGIRPHLSALRVSRVAPLTDRKELSQSIRAQKEFKRGIAPAVHSRVRISRPSTVPATFALIAMLEIDFTTHFFCAITLEKVDATIRGGNVEDLNSPAGLSVPTKCVAYDHITLLYRLTPTNVDDMAKNPSRDLNITIEATLYLSDKCQPKLSLSWVTGLDFTVPVNPGFGPAMQPIQRSNRPSALSIGGGETPLVAQSVSRPDSLPMLEASTHTAETTIPDLGITMTFSAPAGPVYPGDVFTWTVHVVNRSSSSSSASEKGGAIAVRSPRKLALIALPKRRRNDVLRVIRPPSAGGAPRKKDNQVADAFLDENIVHAMQRSSVVDSTDVVCLSADARIGPLAAGTCHVAELKFLAVKEGIMGIEGVRVVDLATQEHVDVRDLPLIMVEKRKD